MSDKITDVEVDPSFAAVQRLASECDELRAEFDRLRRDGQQARAASQRREADLHAKVERLRAALAEVLTIDHSKRGCCDWHVLNGKPWIPAPTGVIHVVSDKEC